MTSATKVRARAASGAWLWCIIRKTHTQTARTLSPCNTAKPTVCSENRRSLGLRGGRFITFASAASATKTKEHEGSMINSRKTIWVGSSSSGQPEKKTGNMESPAMGTWTAKVKAMAFRMLS